MAGVGSAHPALLPFLALTRRPQVPEMSQKPFRVVAKPPKRGSIGASGPIVIKPADGVAHAILLRFRTNDWFVLPLAPAHRAARRRRTRVGASASRPPSSPWQGPGHGTG